MSDVRPPTEFERALAELRGLVGLRPPARPADRALIVSSPGKLPKKRFRRLRAAGGRSGIIALEIIAGLLFVSFALVAALHARLTEGPIDVAFLVSPIEQAINREFSGYQVRIGGAVIKHEGGNNDVRFRLVNVRILDGGGAVVAEAPAASVSLSAQALLAGRIAPAGVSLIAPKVTLSYSEAQGLALSFATDATVKAVVPAPALPPLAETEIPAEVTNSSTAVADTQFALGETFAKFLSAARTRQSASSFLTEIGLQDATVAYTADGVASVFKVPSFTLNLDTRRKRSTIAGSGMVEGVAGPWRFTFSTEDNDRKDSIAIIANVDNLNPRELAGKIGRPDLFGAVDAPTGGEVRLGLARNGDVDQIEASIVLDAGRLNFGSDALAALPIESGLVQFRYSRKTKRLELLPSVIATASSRASLVGVATPKANGSSLSWDYALELRDITLGDESLNLAAEPIDEWSASGSFEPATGLLVLEKMRVRAGEGVLAVTGQASAGTGIALEASATHLPLGTFERLWPVFVSPKTRGWIAGHIGAGPAGQAALVDGRIGLNLTPAVLASISKGGEIPDGALDLDLTGNGIAYRYDKALPPLETAAVRARIAGGKLDVSAPEASVRLDQGGTLAISKISVTSNDFANELPQAVASFDVAAPMAAVGAYLNQPALRANAQGFTKLGLDGDFTGSIRMALPMLDTVALKDMTIRGQARLENLGAKEPIGPFGLQGGTVDLAITEKSVEATGDLLINGVSSKLAFVKLIGANQAADAPLRLSANLDAADRDQLGLSVNHFISGDTPVTVSIDLAKGGEGKPDVSPLAGGVAVEVDLTAAEMVLENMAWRKPPGQSAVLQFNAQAAANGEFALEDFRIVGNDIAIAGRAIVGADRRLREIHLPEFSVNVISHLSVDGVLGADNVWKIIAKGPTYDGRQFFRSLFSAGKIATSELSAAKVESGIDLSAEIGTMIGFSDAAVKNVTLKMQRRRGQLTALDARGTLDTGKPVAVALKADQGRPRLLVAETRDAGRAFKLVGFYGGVVGGEASLEVELDGQKNGAEKNGILWTRNFAILGDKVSDQVLNTNNEKTGNLFAAANARAKSESGRSLLEFERMKVPFSVGYGKLAIYDSYANGQALGATLRGNIDFNRQVVELGGTYVPLYGLNSVLGNFPILGDLLVGRTGEGVLGITFAISGSIAEPQVIVNPISAVAPGVFRQIFEFNQTPGALKPSEPAVARVSKAKPPDAGSAGDLGPSLIRGDAGAVAPQISEGWNSADAVKAPVVDAPADAAPQDVPLPVKKKAKKKKTAAAVIADPAPDWAASATPAP